MYKIKLKKLLAKGEILEVIEKTVKALNIKIYIESDKEIIFGEKGSVISDEKHSISIDNEAIGWVYGEEKASCIALMISFMIKSELEKKKLAEETLERYKEINILYNFTEKIGATLSVENAGRLVTHEIMKYIDTTSVTIMVLDEKKDELRIIGEIYKSTEPKIPFKPLQSIVKSKDPIVQTVIATGKAEIVNNIEKDPRYNDENTKLASMMCIPLIIQNKVVGAIIIGNEKLKEYSASELKLCSLFSFQTGAVIENARLYESLKETFFDTVQTLMELIELKNSAISGHTKRVTNYSVNIARAMGLSKGDQTKTKLAAMLHDIGNIVISDILLQKRGAMTEEELIEVNKHAEIGSTILEKIDQLSEIAPIVRAHHEKLNGDGFPDGLEGEQIPMIARIIAVADCFDSMVHDRIRQEDFNVYFAVEQLAKNSGIQFDRNVVKAFFDIYKGKKLEEIESYVYEPSNLTVNRRE
jgi:putative nucleotidyltransferase with HDIG domain